MDLLNLTVDFTIWIKRISLIKEQIHKINKRPKDPGLFQNDSAIFLENNKKCQDNKFSG